MTTVTSYSTDAAQGFILLTLRDVEALLPSAETRIVDQLVLECVTLPVARTAGEGDIENDVWLVLRVGSHEMPIAPTQVVRHSRSARTFVFESAGTERKWAIKIPEPKEPLDVEDLETFEVVLAQYAAVEEVDVPNEPPPAYSTPNSQPADSLPDKHSQLLSQQKHPSIVPPPLPPRSDRSTEGPSNGGDDLKGRLVLVDENDGEIVGTLGEQFHLREDDALNAKGHEKDPVVIELPDYDEGEMSREVYVHPVPIGQQDTLIKTASLISRGLVYATDAITTGIGATSSFYIAHSTPTEQPLIFSERTRGHVRRVHKFSGKAVEVTAKTTGLIYDALEHAVGYVSGNATRGKEKGKGQLGQGAATSAQLPLKNRLYLSTNMLLTTMEQSAKQLMDHGTLRVSEALAHKYGKDVGDASLLVGHTVRNVGIVYIDARGVGRRALLKRAGKGLIKAKLGTRDVILGVDEGGAMQQTSSPGVGPGISTAPSNSVTGVGNRSGKLEDVKR